MLLSGIGVSVNEDGDPWAAVVVQSIRSAIRQGDIQLEDRAAALILQRDLDLVLVDVHVLADHLDQLLLQACSSQPLALCFPLRASLSLV